MNTKKYITLLTLLVCIVIFAISAKSCIGKNDRKTKVASSNIPVFTISAPSNLTATAIAYPEINLSWQDNSNNEDGFEIQRRTSYTSYNILVTIASDVTSYKDIGIIEGNAYYYRVRAFNTLGDYSAYSNEVSVNPPVPAGWLSVALGESYTLAISSDRTLWAWGNNNSYQLGLGATSSMTITLPTKVGNDTDWAIVASGYYHSFGIKINGSLWSWGTNEYGQLGIGVTSDFVTEPILVGSDSDWLRIVGGANHSIGLKLTGTLWSWGYNSLGQLGLGDSGVGTERSSPTQIGTSSDWYKIASGASHTLGLQTNGILYAWGWNTDRQLGYSDCKDRNTPTQINTHSDWDIIGAGYSTSVAHKTNGAIWKWGRGDGFDPMPIGTDSDWNAVSAGGADAENNYAFALKSNRTIWAWGYNIYGQLGLNDVNERTEPVQVNTLGDWFSIICGGYHTIGVKTNGFLWVWGANDYGQLGLGDTFNRYIPYPLGSPSPPLSLIASFASSSQINLSWSDISSNESGFRIERKMNITGSWEQINSITAGINSYSDISADGFASSTTYYYRVRGYNDMGDSPYSNEAYTALSGNLAKVKAGYHTVLLKTDGKIWVWGYNFYGQLGLGDNGTDRNTPTQMGSNSDWSDIAAGWYHTLGIKTSGTLWSWGFNDAGRLGLGDSGSPEKDRNTPAQVGTDSDWVNIDGCIHSIGVKSNGTLWTWGYNSYGQLGLGDSFSSNNRNTPSLVGTDSDWINAKGGYEHTVGLKTNRTIWSWGRNDKGQLGLGGSGDGTNRLTPTQVGTDSDWVNIDGGYTDTFGVKSNGILWVWGSNNMGQLGLGDSIQRNTPCLVQAGSDWVNIEGGCRYTIGMKNNGTIWSWGRNNYGQLGLGDTINRDTPSSVNADVSWSNIAAGYHHAISSKTNCTIWAWGHNEFGELGLGDTINRYTPTFVGE
jgi:alpha-tubulin suppressor-like RCC1 family protein